MQTCERECPICVGHIEVYQGPKDRRPYFICLRCGERPDTKVLPFIVYPQQKRRAIRPGSRERVVWLC